MTAFLTYHGEIVFTKKPPVGNFQMKKIIAL